MHPTRMITIPLVIVKQDGEQVLIGEAAVDEDGYVEGYIERQIISTIAEKSLGNMSFAMSIPRQIARRIFREKGRHTRKPLQIRTTVSEAYTRAFMPYHHKETNETVFALELTEPLINVIRHTVGLEDLAKAAHPGDFVVGMENRIVPGAEFREQYRSGFQTQT